MGNQIARSLNNIYERKVSLFKEPDELVRRWTDHLWNRIVSENRLDLSLFSPKNRKIDPDTMWHSDVREFGAERMCYNIFRELKIGEVLAKNGFTPDQVKLSQTQIISRAVYPSSELASTKWIQENSAVCELTGYPIEQINKDKLYRNALKLYSVKEGLEKHLSIRTNEIFDIQDRIVLYDLTNTYFEGEKRNSKLAQFGRSKEKRSDAKLVVLALVVNIYGFIKYSSIHEGNFSDASSVSTLLDGLAHSSQTSPSMVVIDAGIATEDNLRTIRSKGYHYLCVSRKKPSSYSYDREASTVEHFYREGKKVELRKIHIEGQSDYYLEVKSATKELKERAMKSRFESGLEEGLEKIKAALTRKGGIKSLDKVNHRLGRWAQKYPSAYAYYDIRVIADEEKQKAIDLNWEKDPVKYARKQHQMGTYHLRSSADMGAESMVWSIYNTIREIESTFRTLKTDLNLRPIFHKNDESTLAHLHLGLLAYWLVNTLRCKLKAQGINHSWKEIVRIGNTQKIITTTGYNSAGCEITVRKCSIPGEKLRKLYDVLRMKPRPFVKKREEKYVVHKRASKKMEPPD